MLQRICGSNVVCSFNILEKKETRLTMQHIIPLSLQCADIVMVTSGKWAQSTTIILCLVTNKQTPNHPGDPREILLLTSEKRRQYFAISGSRPTQLPPKTLFFVFLLWHIGFISLFLVHFVFFPLITLYSFC